VLDLADKRILITSGPTRGPIDAIRYVTNKSTGRLGQLMAIQALERGAAVTFVCGKGSLAPQDNLVDPEAMSRLKVTEIETVDDLLEAIRNELRTREYDAVLHSMAVLDYVPEEFEPTKTPSGHEEWWVKLVRTPKVIKVIRELQPNTLLVGFKLEVGRSREELVRAAHQSLLSNGADYVLANDLVDVERGHHIGYLVNAAGKVEAVVEGKENIARLLLDVVAASSHSEKSSS
jgi:phosphopantothenoylcysteine synthetase/decarboxylase